MGSTADLQARYAGQIVRQLANDSGVSAALKRSAHAWIVNVSSGAGSYADPVFALAVRGGAAARYGISKATVECSDEPLAAPRH